MRCYCEGRVHDHRVLRGGSFNNDRRNARCAFRNRNNLNHFNDNTGFRVALSTLFFPEFRPEVRRGLAMPAFATEAKNGGMRSWPRLLGRPGE